MIRPAIARFMRAAAAAALTCATGLVSAAAGADDQWLVISNRAGVPEIYLHGSEGAPAQRIGHAGQPVFDARWSPSGAQVTFVAAAGRFAHIYLADVATGSVRQLTQGDHLNASPRWSPDGSRIAFVSHRDGNAEIYTMASDGSDQKRLTDYAQDDVAPAWSPDGRQIAFMRNVNRRDLFVMNADGSGQRNLTGSPIDEDEPVWSPDGSRIHYIARQRELTELKSVKPDGSDARVVIGGTAVHSMVFSPDGSQMAYIAKSPDAGVGNLWVARADGQQPRRLSDARMDDLSPAWSTDGRRLYFVSMRNVRPMVFRVEADGSGLAQISQGVGQDALPTIRPSAPRRLAQKE